MQTLELSKMELMPLTFNESVEIDGGGIPWKKVWNGTKWVVEKAGIIDFFSDVWDGIKEGYNEARK
ncbi:MAG: hypothetical protein ACK4RX_06715 [Chitinophagaceae bacterium]|jgi:hypothetical protein